MLPEAGYLKSQLSDSEFVLSALHPTEKARLVAERLTAVLGPQAMVVDRYLDVFASVPIRHMELLGSRGAQLIFAPTLVDAFDSEEADARRGKRLTPNEVYSFQTELSQAAGAKAVYDPELDWLVFPTNYRAFCLVRTVFHEVGHALTLGGATIRPSLLDDLPPDIQRHLRNPAYGNASDPLSLQRHVHEVLAEAYVYVMLGKESELPRLVREELMLILQTVVDDGSRSGQLRLEG